MNTRSYITTAIPYVNASPHVGFALELTQADATARRHRAAGRPTRFQTGTDENAFKNVEAARAAGADIPEWVDARSAQFRQLADRLEIGYDRFLRTTEQAHARGVHLLWRSLRPGDVFQQNYTGLYCSGCEDFLFPKDLVEGLCPDHQAAPVPVAETNYFFRLSAYQEPLERWLSGEAVAIRPEWRRDEILSFVRAGLRDISISRPAARSEGWGVPVPDDDSQIVYVWIDALVNYLTGLGYGTDEGWRDWWNGDTQKIHVIGKNVWKFHANQDLEQVKPWVALREGSTPKVRGQIAVWLGQLTDVTRQIEPFLPNTSRQILRHLAEQPLRPIAPLFPRQ